MPHKDPLDPTYAGPIKPEYVSPGEEAARDLASRKALQEEWRRKDAAREQAAMEAQKILEERAAEEARIRNFINRPGNAPSKNPYDASYTQGETKLSTGAWIGPSGPPLENPKTPGAGPRQQIYEGQPPVGDVRRARNWVGDMTPEEQAEFNKKYPMPR